MCLLEAGTSTKLSMFTVNQGNKAEELPEQILCCIRVSGLDYMNYQQLGLSQESLE